MIEHARPCRARSSPASLAAAPVVADEGMWTFDNPPLEAAARRSTASTPTTGVARQGAPRLGALHGRGSGSFVSPDGLMITNHHVGLGCIQNVSSAENDYVKNGFYAPTRDKEAACPGYEVNVLVSMEDVTARVQGAVKAADVGHGRPARPARRRPPAIENECNAAHEAALRRGDPLPGRRVPALPLQEVHGRAARVRPRAGRSPSSAATPTTSPSPATTSTSA